MTINIRLYPILIFILYMYGLETTALTEKQQEKVQLGLQKQLEIRIAGAERERVKEESMN